MANAGRESDKYPLKQLGDVAKLKENSFYRKIIENLVCQKSAKFRRHEWVVDTALRSPFFDDLKEIDGAYEVKVLISMVLLYFKW